jgi:ADP-heptose:LPS heptosyltransferase
MEKVILHEQGRYKPVRCDRPKPDDNWPYHNHPTTPHDREFGIKNPKFERHIFIRRDQVSFDLDAQLGMIADSRKKPDGSVDDTITNATSKYQQQFYRWIDKHIGVAKNKMQTFVLEKFKTTKMNSISQVEEVDIELLMPEWWDDTVFDQLCQAVHDYVVNATLADYFTLRPDMNDLIVMKRETANDNLNDIKKLANSAKPGRIRKPFKPF